MKTSRLPSLALAMNLALTGAITTALPAAAADVVTGLDPAVIVWTLGGLVLLLGGGAAAFLIARRR